MKKRISFLCLILTAAALISCNLGKGAQENKEIITFQLTPSSDGTEAFLELLGDNDPKGYETDTCYRVSPESVAETYGFEIYKFDASCGSFLLYENQIYPLGTWFGGLGATSFAVADLNSDGHEELYFTFSWGSGLHHSMAGYFDTEDREIKSFELEHVDKDSVLTADEENNLWIYSADCEGTSFVDLKLTPKTKLGAIRFESGEITFSSVH